MWHRILRRLREMDLIPGGTVPSGVYMWMVAFDILDADAFLYFYPLRRFMPAELSIYKMAIAHIILAFVVNVAICVIVQVKSGRERVEPEQ